MYFKQFLHDETGCASYFLASRQSREAMVIDPQLDIQPYLDLAQEREYRITDVVDTHLHADHISGNRALRDKTGARLWLHESADVRFPFEPLRERSVRNGINWQDFQRDKPVQSGLARFVDQAHAAFAQ